MKQMDYLFLLLLPFLSACGGASKEKAHPERIIETGGSRWELVWNDEFDYRGLPDPARWNFDLAGNEEGWGNNEAQWYTGEPENAWVADGVLTLTARHRECNGKKYTSARITTRNKGDWKYGRIEVRALLPAGNGTWAAIWMLPTAQRYGKWPHSGEIDIMEHVGYAPDSVYSTVHTSKYNHLLNTQVGKATECTTVASHYHTYALEWDEKQIRSYIDDTLYFTFSPDDTGYEGWPFDQEFHLLLNLAVGGNWGGRKGIDDSAFPHRMQVDYVRVYRQLE